MKKSFWIRFSMVPMMAQAILLCTAWAQPPADKPATPDTSTLLYVGLFNGQAVNVYDSATGSQKSRILDGVFNVTGGLAVDRARKVYVATGSGSVVAYERGELVPTRRFQFPDQGQPVTPQGIAVGKDGTFYAASYHDGAVFAYKADVKQASLVIKMPSGQTAFAVALDAQNNLYIAYGGPLFGDPGHIEKCAPASADCTDLGITVGTSGTSLALDAKGNLITCDQLASTINVYPPGSTTPRVISQGLVGCPFFALNQTQDLLYVANQPHSGNNRGVSVFDYASGSPVKTISTGIPADDLIFGIALNPAAQ
jgi:hypothetical protein